MSSKCRVRTRFRDDRAARIPWRIGCFASMRSAACAASRPRAVGAGIAGRTLRLAAERARRDLDHRVAAHPLHLPRRIERADEGVVVLDGDVDRCADRAPVTPEARQQDGALLGEAVERIAVRASHDAIAFFSLMASSLETDQAYPCDIPRRCSGDRGRWPSEWAGSDDRGTRCENPSASSSARATSSRLAVTRARNTMRAAVDDLAGVGRLLEQPRHHPLVEQRVREPTVGRTNVETPVELLGLGPEIRERHHRSQHIGERLFGMTETSVHQGGVSVNSTCTGGSRRAAGPSQARTSSPRSPTARRRGSRSRCSRCRAPTRRVRTTRRGRPGAGTGPRLGFETGAAGLVLERLPARTDAILLREPPHPAEHGGDEDEPPKSSRPCGSPRTIAVSADRPRRPTINQRNRFAVPARIVRRPFRRSDSCIGRTGPRLRSAASPRS